MNDTVEVANAKLKDAVTFARNGHLAELITAVNSIGSLFFPVSDDADVMWPDTRRSMLCRSILFVFDCQMVSDLELRRQAKRELWSMDVLRCKLDELWNKVTLFTGCQLLLSVLVGRDLGLYNCRELVQNDYSIVRSTEIIVDSDESTSLMYRAVVGIVQTFVNNGVKVPNDLKSQFDCFSCMALKRIAVSGN